MCADGVIQSGCKKESSVVTGLQITGAHLAAIFRPSFGHIGAGQRPLTADTDPGQQAKQSQFPNVLRDSRQSGEQGVNQHRGGEHASASEAVGNRSPDERQTPADEKQRE